MIARKDFTALDRLFQRTLRQSLGILLVLLAICMAGILALQSLYPRFAHRMISPWAFVLLFLAVIAVFIVQCQAIYLRAHKREPFLWQSIGTAVITCLGITLFIPRWGTFGAAAAYVLGAVLVGLPWAAIIFGRVRRSHSRVDSTELPEPVSSDGALGRIDGI